MGNPFIKFDTWLIERVFEPVAWWIEARTGWSNFRQAQYALIGLILGAVIDLQAYQDTVLYALLLTFFGIAGVYALVMFFKLGRLDNSLRPGVINPHRFMVGSIALRMFWLAMIFPCIVLLVNGPSAGSFLVALSLSVANYLEACNAMPPTKRQEVEHKAAERRMQAQPTKG